MAQWTADAPFGSGERDLTRLAGIAGLPCDEAPRPPNSERPGISGQWYDPAQDGQGWLLQEVRPNELFMAWFTYDDQGHPAWIVGSGTLDGASARFDELLITRGTRFGDDFDASVVQRIPWGTATIDFLDCGAADLRWTTDRTGFVDGRLAPVRLTRIDALACAIDESTERQSSVSGVR